MVVRDVREGSLLAMSGNGPSHCRAVLQPFLPPHSVQNHHCHCDLFHR